ncbi:MAG: DUF4389 domain-containing protein [Candidatus Dormibacteria bacterium]|jgi:hypothetical protein
MDNQVAASSYPTSLTGSLDPGMSRWLWLVKWLLAIPHVVVLAALWIAAGVLTFVAGLVILVTGRYPRPIFDFNVGVMRWSWRVAFYAYAALGTDRYPPFSLHSDPTYPADFAVEYPEHLSRGLVLIKWWLLAIPQYLVVVVLTGGFGVVLGGPGHIITGSGLIALLVLIAAVALLFSGTYPRPLFDLTMGLDRWCYRVLAYTALMTDQYPPFRLDCGGTESSATVQATAGPARGGRAAPA